MDVSSALSAAAAARWQAAYDDDDGEAVFRSAWAMDYLRFIFLLYVKLYTLLYCCLHVFAVCLDHAGVLQRAASRLQSPSLSHSAHHHHHHAPALAAAGTADLRKPNSDSCRYEPLMSLTCTRLHSLLLLCRVVV